MIKLKELLKHYLGDIIYGANGGIITTFTIICDRLRNGIRL